MDRKNTQREVTPWLSETPSHIIGDVTARDGIQAIPWYHVPTKEQRAQLARKMMQAGIPHIEIGFPVIDGDPETLAVRHVVEQTRNMTWAIFTLARLREDDIGQCVASLEGAKYGGVHVFVGTSPEHREALGKTQEQILAEIPSRMKQVRDAWMMCQFSAEDATRTEYDFLAQVYRVAEDSGAQILNIPDTVWFCNPDKYSEIISIVRESTRAAILSAHCHNDMSCAEANPLTAISRGLVEKIEGTIFGIGERAWNTDLVSLMMTLMQHPEYSGEVSYLLKHPKHLASLIELVQSATGYTGRPVQPGYWYDAMVNRSGVHQAKVAKMKKSYVWIDPEQFGLRDRDLVDIGPLAGKAGVEVLLKEWKIMYEEKDLSIITQLLRSIFSPDTNISDIESTFPQLDEEEITRLSDKVQEIRREARLLVPTIQRQKDWRKRTHTIMKKTVGYFYSKR